MAEAAEGSGSRLGELRVKICRAEGLELRLGELRVEGQGEQT